MTQIDDEVPSIRRSDSLWNNKRFLVLLIILGIGIASISTGIVLGLDTEKYTNDQIVYEQFPTVLLAVKRDIEDQFDDLIEEMKEDPLDGLMVDKLPSSEEIFFEEWANDWFPHVDIPTIGGYIESVGAKAVGDINLDGNPPVADLNITNNNKPSGMTQIQCRLLWDPSKPNSLVNRPPNLWYDIIDGNEDHKSEIMENFNLTEIQLNLICNWINISKYTWLPNLAKLDRITINPLPFLAC